MEGKDFEWFLNERVVVTIPLFERKGAYELPQRVGEEERVGVIREARWDSSMGLQLYVVDEDGEILTPPLASVRLNDRAREAWRAEREAVCGRLWEARFLLEKLDCPEGPELLRELMQTGEFGKVLAAVRGEQP